MKNNFEIMRWALVLLAGIITSFFFFPFEFVFLPEVNTKKIVAVVGLLLLIYQCISSGKASASKEFFVASIIAAVFSLIGLHAVVYNNTDDYAYATYIVSMWVWAAAAYATCYIISRIHGYLSFKLVINYLIGVCFLQCVSALLIDFSPSVKTFVDEFLFDSALTGTARKVERLYGIGATLDVAGTRFASVLVMIVFLICKDDSVRYNRKQIAGYTTLFTLIAVVGSMIARTTSVGIVLAFVYVVYASGIWKIRIKNSSLKLWAVLIGVFFVLIWVCTYLYNNIFAFRDLLRFGFEGFINWLETGEWRTNSTDSLIKMWRLPETLKTWVVGDGHFDGIPGKPGFYMGTDVGYLRFIYYCGLPGLLVFCGFFVYLTIALHKKHPRESHLFVLLLIIVFAVWVKVSTDIFLVYALFMCIPKLQKQTKKPISRI